MLLKILLLVSLPSFLVAQTVDEEITLIQTLYGVEKRKLVSDYMQIPDQFAEAFWKTYDQYEAERRELGHARLLLINDYAESFGSLTEETADKLAQAVLANNIQVEKLNESYYKKFKKETSALKAAQFMQLETYLQNVVRSEIQAGIPFIGEIERLRN